MCLCPQGPRIKGQMARVCERWWGASLTSLHEYLSPPCVRSSSQRHLECVSASPSCAAAGSVIDPAKRGILPPLPFLLWNLGGGEYFPLGSAIGLSEGLEGCVCVCVCVFGGVAAKESSYSSQFLGHCGANEEMTYFWALAAPITSWTGSGLGLCQATNAPLPQSRAACRRAS